MSKDTFPVHDFQPTEVSFQVGEPSDLSQLPESSPIFENQSWHEAAHALSLASVASINPVHLVVGESPESPAGPLMKTIAEDNAYGIVDALVNPTLEVLPVGNPKFYDTQTGDVEEEDDLEVLESTDDKIVLNEVGLYRVDKGALQACVAIVIEQAMELAYVAGRLDQANAGTNRPRFIAARDLASVTKHAEWLASTPQTNTETNYAERAQQVINNAVRKFGSVAVALAVKKPKKL